MTRSRRPRSFDGSSSSIPPRPSFNPFGEAAIKAANPARGTFLNPREVLAQAADAARMLARLSSFRNLVLNQRVETARPSSIDQSAWQMRQANPRDITGLEACSAASTGAKAAT